MQVFSRTISSIFGQEKRYVIPLFQRPYVWKKEDQWEPLWEDIVEKATLALAPQPTDSPPHFLGAIVIQQRKCFGDELLAHDVIDGQQRLTTFQIFLAAFRDLAAARGDAQTASWLVSLTRNANPVADPDIEQFKVWPTSRDVSQFRLVSTAGSRAAVELVHPAVLKRKRLQPRPRLIEAYIYFSNVLEKWLLEGGDAGVANHCRALRRVLDRQFQLVSIELEGQEDPQVIFETLNARGVPLLASDLLRNFIFQRAGSPDEADRLYDKYWARFEVPNNADAPEGLRFWEVEERQGRLCRARLDLFIQHYLAMKRQQDVSSSRLYPQYKKWIDDQPAPRFASVEAELKDLTLFADHFQKLLRPDRVTPIGRFANHLKVLDISTIYPLVLGLLGNTALPEAERTGILQDLESFLVRRLICERTTKNYNHLFLQLLNKFETGKAFTREAFRGLLKAGTGDAVDWPDDVAFERAWNTLDAYTALRPAQVEMILRAIEADLHGPKNERIVIEGPLTIEHVMPQSWKSHWPLPASLDADTAAEARDDVIHDFGNLTLITHALNNSVSNGPAAKKLPEIAKQGMLILSTYFQGRTEWTEKDILARGATLFQTAKKIWPRPEHSV